MRKPPPSMLVVLALDRQALAMASKPERFPAPSEGLRDREIAVLVPIVFRLER